MTKEVLIGILIPFLGTTLGAACVFFLKGDIKESVQKALMGFASGVMIAASVWSVIIPSIDMSVDMGRFAFVPAVVGFLLGMIFLLIMDKIIPHVCNVGVSDGAKTKLQKDIMLVLAVTLHNLPEGMAVGVVFAGVQSDTISLSGAIAMTLGIAIQNFPEGAIISMPLKSGGMKKGKAFLYGVLSGIVEPIGALVAIALFSRIIMLLPYVLSFAAGAMIYVVIEELIPEMAQGKRSDMGTMGFALGFIIMMILDVQPC